MNALSNAKPHTSRAIRPHRLSAAVASIFPRAAARKTVKPIERVLAGDLVWAWDETAKILVKRRVSRLYRNRNKPVLDVVLETRTGATESIVATTEHPFWVEGKGWVAARLLKTGDPLRSVRGKGGVRVLRVVDTSATADVFNFEVEGAHNYFVGTRGILVHNMSEYRAGGGKYSFEAGRERGANIPYDKASGTYMIPMAQEFEIPTIVPLENLRTGEPLRAGSRPERVVVNVHGARVAKSLQGNPEQWYFRLPEGTSLVTHAPPGTTLMSGVSRQIITGDFSHQIYREQVTGSYSNQLWTRNTDSFDHFAKAGKDVDVYTVPKVIRQADLSPVFKFPARDLLVPNLGELLLATCNRIDRDSSNSLSMGRQGIAIENPSAQTLKDVGQTVLAYQRQTPGQPARFVGREFVNEAWRRAGLPQPRWWW